MWMCMRVAAVWHVCVRARVCVLCVRVCVIHDDMNCDRPTNMRKK